MSDRIRIFVSSTYEDNARDREFIEAVFEEMNIDTELFPEKSTGGRRKEYLDSLARSQFMVLLVPKIISEPVREEVALARRSGIPIIPFFRVGPKASHEFKSPAITKRAAAAGLLPLAEHAVIYSQLSQLKSGLRQGVSTVLASRMSHNFVLSPWTENAYAEATLFLNNPGARLALAQSTSSLILGASASRLNEARFLDSLWPLIPAKTSVSHSVTEFLHVFDADATMHELLLHGTDGSYPDAKLSIRRLESLLRGTRPPRVKIVPASAPVTPAMVGDEKFEMATTFGVRRYYLWVESSQAGATQLWHILNEMRPTEPIGAFLQRAKSLL